MPTKLFTKLLLCFLLAVPLVADAQTLNGGKQQPYLNITGPNQLDGVSINPNTAGAGNFTTLAASGNVAVATNKFTVTAASGNTVVAGTLNVTGLTTPTGGLAGVPPVACGATCTLGSANAGTYTRLDTAAGSVATLPGATGSGTAYKLYVSVATTSAADKVLTNPVTDTIIGTAIGENAATAKVFVGNASTYHSIQMPFAGSQPSGGFIGDTIICTDVASTIWKCDINYQGGTTPTTPYSASTT